MVKLKKKAWAAWVQAGRPRDADNIYWIEYKKAKADVRREIRRAEFEYVTSIIDDLEKSERLDERQFWYLVNRNRHRESVVNPIRNANGELVTEPTEVIAEWEIYYRDMYEKKIKYNEYTHFQQVEESVSRVLGDSKYESVARMPIVVQEVNSIIAKLKCRKAPGWDNITAEHLKYSGPICRRILTWILNSSTSQYTSGKV